MSASLQHLLKGKVGGKSPVSPRNSGTMPGPAAATDAQRKPGMVAKTAQTLKPAPRPLSARRASDHHSDHDAHSDHDEDDHHSRQASSAKKPPPKPRTGTAAFAAPVKNTIRPPSKSGGSKNGSDAGSVPGSSRGGSGPFSPVKSQSAHSPSSGGGGGGGNNSSSSQNVTPNKRPLTGSSPSAGKPSPLPLALDDVKRKDPPSNNGIKVIRGESATIDSLVSPRLYHSKSADSYVDQRSAPTSPGGNLRRDSIGSDTDDGSLDDLIGDARSVQSATENVHSLSLDDPNAPQNPDAPKKKLRGRALVLYLVQRIKRLEFKLKERDKIYQHLLQQLTKSYEKKIKVLAGEVTVKDESLAQLVALLESQNSRLDHMSPRAAADSAKRPEFMQQVKQQVNAAHTDEKTEKLKQHIQTQVDSLKSQIREMGGRRKPEEKEMSAIDEAEEEASTEREFSGTKEDDKRKKKKR